MSIKLFALRATTDAVGGAGLRPRPAGLWRNRVQAHIRPRPRLSDALHRRQPTRKPASRDTELHRKAPYLFEARPQGSLQAIFRGIQCRAKPASVSAGRGGDAAHRKGGGMAVAMLAWAGAIPCPKAANGGPPRQRLPWSRESAQLRTLCASALKSPPARPASGAFWEFGVQEKWRFLIYIFISVIDAQLAFLSFHCNLAAPAAQLPTTIFLLAKKIVDTLPRFGYYDSVSMCHRVHS